MSVLDQSLGEKEGGWLWEFTLEPPAGSPLLQLTFPEESGLLQVRVNGVLALDTSIETKRKRSDHTLRLVYPGATSLKIELLTETNTGFTADGLSWHKLPDVLVAPFTGYWPDDAQPFLYGPRAEKIQKFEFTP